MVFFFCFFSIFKFEVLSRCTPTLLLCWQVLQDTVAIVGVGEGSRRSGWGFQVDWKKVVGRGREGVQLLDDSLWILADLSGGDWVSLFNVRPRARMVHCSERTSRNCVRCRFPSILLPLLSRAESARFSDSFRAKTAWLAVTGALNLPGLLGKSWNLCLGLQWTLALRGSRMSGEEYSASDGAWVRLTRSNRCPKPHPPLPHCC